jgi:Rad3-related DNA helicase
MSLSSLPTPVELGFPSKFAQWYDDQIVAIDRTVFNSRRFTALNNPTGGGKSAIGMAIALLHPKVTRALYLTSTKGLQDQLITDFHGLGLIDVRGARNYPCEAVLPGAILDRYRGGRFTSNCDEGPCHSGVRCRYAPQRDLPGIRPDCTYYGAVYDARNANLVSSNYAMYFAQSEFAEGLGKFDLLILDEAHNAVNELETFLTLDITKDDVKARWIGGDSLSVWKEWATWYCQQLGSRIEELDHCPPANADEAQERRRMKISHRKIQRLSEIVPLDWVMETVSEYHVRFAPLRIGRYAEDVLFRGIPHVLLMSATLTRKTTQLLGIPAKDLELWESPNRFPVKQRPIICINTSPGVKVDARMSDNTKYMWMRRIDRLVDPRRALSWKGIAHTVSYVRMRELYLASDHRDIMIVHDPQHLLPSGPYVFTALADAVQCYKSLPGPLVLVSPSLIAGYNFPYDECRYQIIGKVPIPDTRGAIMQARVGVDEELSGYIAMEKLVQTSGRGVRILPDDWCETFIVDDHFATWFLKKYCKHAPKWFLDAIEHVDHFPPPLFT